MQPRRRQIGFVRDIVSATAPFVPNDAAELRADADPRSRLALEVGYKGYG